MRKAWWMGVVIVCCAIQALPAMAAEGEPPQTYARGFTRKLGRGIANIFTAPLELIRVPTLVAHKEGGVAGLSVGIVRGAWSGLVREAAGWVEVLTFPIGIPRDFEPLVHPEYVYAHGDWAE